MKRCNATIHRNQIQENRATNTDTKMIEMIVLKMQLFINISIISVTDIDSHGASLRMLSLF